MLLSFSYLSAQDNADTGVWSDVTLTHSVTKSIDLTGGVRFDTKGNSSRFAEQRIYVGFNFKHNKFTVSPAVIFLKNFSRVPYYETRPQITLSYKTLLNGIGISPKVRIEYHAKRELSNDGRIVPVLSIDKKVSKNYSIFNTDEFWISVNNHRDVTNKRKRLFFGVTRTINPHLSMDLFYLYQRDEQSAPLNTHKLGITWKIRV